MEGGRRAGSPNQGRPFHARRRIAAGYTPAVKALRPVIGWREWAALPDLGVRSIKAKIDTGARSASIHAFDIEHSKRQGRPMVRFTLHPMQRKAQPSITCEAELVEYRTVRNPGGREERRPVIRTPVQIGDQTFAIDLTLARRDTMGFRMLLGRQAIRGRFVVDPGRSFVVGRRPPRGD